MRLNRLVASGSQLSRRQADAAIAAGRVKVNGQPGSLGQDVSDADDVRLDDNPLELAETSYLLLNKPAGVVCSRNGQGSKTVYDLLPPKYHHLQPVGRLDKDSRGLLLLTNDGQTANQLSHPRFGKIKTYQVTLDRPLTSKDKTQASRGGVTLEDGLSVMNITGSGRKVQVVLAEGRNRQIRRTFAALGYKVVDLQRTSFGKLKLGGIPEGSCREVAARELA